MELQPEDVRVPSEESSPTHVPPDDLLPYQEQIGASLAPRISATRTSSTTLVRSPIQLTVIGQWLNHMRNGPVDDPTLNATGSIALGSTTKLCLGITIILNFTNLQLGISSMITQLLIGHILSHAFGAPGAGN